MTPSGYSSTQLQIRYHTTYSVYNQCSNFLDLENAANKHYEHNQINSVYQL